MQRVREAERQQVVDAWKDRVGELVTGVVKRAERGNIFVDLGGNAEGFIPKDKSIPRDVLPALPAAANFACVLEEAGGALSYWALEHPETKPDFHSPACFAAVLAPPKHA